HPPPRLLPLFPYTTLFRSGRRGRFSAQLLGRLGFGLCSAGQGMGGLPEVILALGQVSRTRPSGGEGPRKQKKVLPGPPCPQPKRLCEHSCQLCTGRNRRRPSLPLRMPFEKTVGERQPERSPRNTNRSLPSGKGRTRNSWK